MHVVASGVTCLSHIAQGAMNSLCDRWAQEQAASNSSWAARLEEAHSKWLREKGELERAAAEKLVNAQELAAARYDSLRGHLEGRVAAISERLAALAAKEGKKDQARKELKQQVRQGWLRAPDMAGCGYVELRECVLDPWVGTCTICSHASW